MRAAIFARTADDTGDGALEVGVLATNARPFPRVFAFALKAFGTQFDNSRSVLVLARRDGETGCAACFRIAPPYRAIFTAQDAVLAAPIPSFVARVAPNVTRAHCLPGDALFAAYAPLSIFGGPAIRTRGTTSECGCVRKRIDVTNCAHIGSPFPVKSSRARYLIRSATVDLVSGNHGKAACRIRSVLILSRRTTRAKLDPGHSIVHTEFSWTAHVARYRALQFGMCAAWASLLCVVAAFALKPCGAADDSQS